MSILIELLPAAGPVLIVGGGPVALRRAARFAAAGFSVELVAPEVVAELQALPGVSVALRPFADGDIPGHALVCACTGSREVNARVGALARAAGIPVVVADRFEESTFSMPAIHRDGALVVGVGTGGASPRLARELRDRLAGFLGPGWALRVEQARAERRRARDQEPGP